MRLKLFGSADELKLDKKCCGVFYKYCYFVLNNWSKKNQKKLGFSFTHLSSCIKDFFNKNTHTLVYHDYHKAITIIKNDEPI